MKKVLVVLAVISSLFLGGCASNPQMAQIVLGTVGQILQSQTQQGRIAQDAQVYNQHPPYATQEEAMAEACAMNPGRPGCPQPVAVYPQPAPTARKTQTNEERVRQYCAQHPSEQECRNLGY